MKLKNIAKIIIFTIIIVLISFNQVLALTDIQLRAADMNWDGQVNINDMALLLSMGVPEAPVDGIKSPDGNYFTLYSMSGASSLSGSEIGLAFTQIHEEVNIFVYCKGKEECCKTAYIKQSLTKNRSPKQIDDAKKYYYIAGDGTNNGTLNYGYGVMVYHGYYNHVEAFAKYGIDIKSYVQSRKKMEVEIADNVSRDLWLGYRQWVVNKIESLGYHASDLESYQIDCLTDIKYQGYSSKVAEIVRAYMNANKQCTAAVRNAAGKSMKKGTNRGEDRWVLFSQGIYRLSGDGGKEEEYVFNPADFASFGNVNGDAPATELQKRIVEVALHSDSYGIEHKKGYCLRWVREVYTAAGVENQDNKNCARCQGYHCGVSTDMTSIPLGAAIFTQGGHKIYGHVGIYIGNNEVISNLSRKC